MSFKKKHFLHSFVIIFTPGHIGLHETVKTPSYADLRFIDQILRFELRFRQNTWVNCWNHGNRMIIQIL
jgi:hypothetical protein